MKFSFEIRYEASLEQVYAMLADSTFRDEVCTRGHAVDHTVEITPHAEGMTAVVDQTLPARNVPSFAQKFVGDRIQIVQTEEWTGPEGASFHVAIPGKPGQVDGRIVLAAMPTGIVETFSGEVKVSLPLIGGKLESLVIDLLGASVRNEQRVGREWLGGEP